MDKKVLNRPVKRDKRTYNNIENITNGQGDDYAAGCFLGYSYFE